MRVILFSICAFLFIGCTQFGIQAETPKQKLVVLEYSYQGALKTVKQMAINGTLKGQNAQKATELIKQASTALKSARATIKVGGSDIDQSIFLANSVLNQLIIYIESKKDKVSWATYSLQSKLSPLYSQRLAQLLNPYNESRRLSIWRKVKAETLTMRKSPQSPARQIYLNNRPSIS